jgi:rod shape-determining protein MreD
MKGIAISKCLIVMVSFLLALMLMILPLPGWANWLRPEWVPMVLICWTLIIPSRISIGWAFIIGLLLDALTGTILGEHALALVIIAYFITKFQLRISLFGLLQQFITVFITVIIYQLCLLCVQGLTGSGFMAWQYWLSSLTSALLWPWMFILLRGFYLGSK